MLFGIFFHLLFKLEQVPVKVRNKQPILNHTVLFKLRQRMQLCYFCADLFCRLQQLLEIF